MKKLFVSAAMLALLSTSCSEDQTTLTPGDPADPGFQTLVDEFGNVDESTNSMTGMSFEIIGAIMDGGAGPAKPTLQGVEYTLDYDTETDFWVAHLVLDDGAGNLAVISDSVQFIQDGHPRRIPNPDSLDVVRCFLTMEASGEKGTLSGFQNVTLVPDYQDTTVLATVDGRGGLQGTYVHENTDSTGTTQCTVGAAFSSTFSRVVVDVTNGTPAGCPLAGTVTHRGDLSVLCTGAKPLTHEGSWSINLTFVDGDSVRVSAVRGDNIWNFTTPCGD
jgi:hypothetical protein